MKKVQWPTVSIKRNALIKSLEKAISEANEYAEKMEYASEALLFAKANAPIALMQLKKSIHELKGAAIRKNLIDGAREIFLDGSESISSQTLFDAIRKMDDEAQIRTVEFFHLKDILILSAANVFSSALSDALIIQKYRLDAEKWVEDENGLRLPSDQVFFLEHGLKIAYEADQCEKTNMLLSQIASLGKTENDIVEIASRRLSDIQLKMTNAVNLIHLAVNIDWQKAYETLSHTEKILMSDPGGVYPRMDSESKSAVRRALETLCIYSHFSESSVSAQALTLVEERFFTDITQALYTDEGREEILKRLNAKSRIPKLRPDPNGHKLICFQLIATLLLFALSCIWFKWPACIILLPVHFAAFLDIFRFWMSKRVKTHALLALNMESVPQEAKTLVVIPALLTKKESALKVVNRLWEHGVHEKDENIDFMILGDFKDSYVSENETDGEIVSSVKAAISILNKEAGRKKYFYLQRKRVYNEGDKLWMGRERKRGALEDLNHLIVTGENRFSDSTEDAEKMHQKYTYLLTVDSDTRFLPGEIRKLIGTIAHPLNRDYGVIQPRMETIPGDMKNLFSEWLSGIGGTDHYDVCASDFYQDLTGEGLFSGKGIINIQKFYERTYETFQENTVLSHDMIEGILAKAAFAGNCVMFETFPENCESYLKRLDRWTRGDWQLIHYLFGRIKLSALGRFKILSNMMRSLKSAAVLMAIVISFWRTNLPMLLYALITHFLPVLLHGRGALKPCFMSFLHLPSIAFTEVCAAFKALYRLYVTKRKRLEWVTAAEYSMDTQNANLPGIFASILLIPGLFSGKTILSALVIGALFAFGKQAILFFQKTNANDTLPTEDLGYLSDLSRSIWKYFEKYVPLNGNGLPPDNVQLEPAVGVQMRTSPTNIGMYILSVIAAEKLGLIEIDEAVIRLRTTLESIQRLETWNGLFYNWYDGKTLMPVRPRYISSVDIGNLLAAFVVSRNYLCSQAPDLSDAFGKLIEEADLTHLYNKKRKLFRIGYDAENNRMSDSHYDLFASEARILSFVAMAEKGIELSHWKYLARPFSVSLNKPVVLSWSGTMFEYLMPNLLMPSTSGSLVKNTEKYVVEKQKQKGKNGIWGISESGYAAFDSDLNYQYHAFGVSELALSGEATKRVYSPYSVILSLEHSLESGVECLTAMQEVGLRGEHGFYEAIDLTKEDRAQIVYSYMTHHQGMSFVSVCNLLTGNAIKRLFLNHPKESSLRPLLSEKPFVLPFKKILFKEKEETVFSDAPRYQKPGEYARIGRSSFHEGHVLFAKGALVYIEPSGRGFYRKNGIYANFWSAEAAQEANGFLPGISDETGCAKVQKSFFDPGFTRFELATGKTNAEIICTLNPENGRLLIKTTLQSNSSKEEQVKVEHKFRLCLTDEETMHAHPVFADLFVRQKDAGNFAKRYFRKNRESLKEDVALLHMTDSAISETGEKEKAHAKYAYLKREANLNPFEKKEMYFEVGIESGDEREETAPSKAAFDRCVILLRAQINAHIQFCGLTAAEYRHIDRMSANIFSVYAKTGDKEVRANSLWALGIPSDKPLLVCHATQKSSLGALRKLVRAHEFYRYCGISLPLVILHVRETEYFTPLYDAINRILSSSHLGGVGGAHLISKEQVNEEQLTALHALSALCVKNDFLKDTLCEKRSAEPQNPRKEAKILSDKKKAHLLEDNGYGGFAPNETCYRIYVDEKHIPPRRWSNYLANGDFGAVTNELGIANVYFQNSRMGRITPFENDLDFPRFGIELYAYENGKMISLTPGNKPKGAYVVNVKPGETSFEVETEDAEYRTVCFVDPVLPIFYAKIELKNKSADKIEIELGASVRYLLGTDLRDLRFTRIDKQKNRTYAHGKAGFTAFSGFLDGEAEDGGNRIKLSLQKEKKAHCVFCLGAVQNGSENIGLSHAEKACFESCRLMKERFNKIACDTGNPTRDQVLNGFLKAQTLFSRFYARFGPYQPGGAYGMRDQLQDLLSIMYFDRTLAKKHLLLCASRQFEKGDGLHWWHMPSSGVRTRISDDILFLPLITAKYIALSGDRGILSETVPFLKDIPIPENQEDLYRAFEETEFTSPLYDHIMRAFKYVNRRGNNGLLLMGAGDWNDGMNKIGSGGKGESVWLSEFFLYTAKEFMPFTEKRDRAYLENECKSLKESIEKNAWDGEWYLRAFDDNGNKIGSHENDECRIDLISQAWAIIAGLDEERSKSALLSAEKHLVDAKSGMIRLLTPPFSGESVNPGYIGAYPPGVRENGGQYTHGACWMVKAYAKLNMAQKAWKAFDMLLPINRTNTKEKCERYGGEPYVIAADISGNDLNQGACGWTWYTGAAAWAQSVLIEDLLGVQMIANRVKMQALLPENAESMACRIQVGASVYTLVSKRNTDQKERFIELVDDGKTHEFVFPARG